MKDSEHYERIEAALDEAAALITDAMYDGLEVEVDVVPVIGVDRAQRDPTKLLIRFDINVRRQLMGILYYAIREDADGQLFALNKVYRYLPDMTDWADFRPLPSRQDFKAMAMEGRDPGYIEWIDRIYDRLNHWADGHRVRVASEDEICEMFDCDDEDNSRITGSAHDQDYEADGMTYRPGSAW